MKLGFEGKYLALFSFILLSAGLSSYYLYAQMRGVRRFTFSFDTCVAQGVRDQITKMVKAQSNQTPSKIGTSIHAKFPSISGVEFERCAPGVVHCAVHSLQPLVTVNHQLIVTDSGELLAKDFFSQRSTDYLYDVTIAQKQLPQSVQTPFLKMVDYLMPNFFTRYAISWIDEKEVWLREKDQTFAIVCNADTLPDDRILSYCEQLKQGVLTAQAEKKGRKQQWAADIRFEHQLILFADKEGVGHG